MYRLVPNATHSIQPLDKGVVGPLKKRWFEVVRRYIRDNPGAPIGKENFTKLLKEVFLCSTSPLQSHTASRVLVIIPVMPMWLHLPY